MEMGWDDARPRNGPPRTPDYRPARQRVTLRHGSGRASSSRGAVLPEMRTRNDDETTTSATNRIPGGPDVAADSAAVLAGRRLAAVARAAARRRLARAGAD